MYAHDCQEQPGAGNRFRHVGTKRYVELHMMKEPVVEVKITESASGTYFGWLKKGETVPCHIWGNQSLFDMCFPGGAKEEEAKGNGKAIRLAIQPV